MTYRFNPFTGKLTKVGGENLSTQVVFNKFEAIVSPNDIAAKRFDLGLNPLPKSEVVFLNGLAQDTSCYEVVGTEIIFNSSFDLRVNDNIIISYAS